MVDLGTFLAACAAVTLMLGTVFGLAKLAVFLWRFVRKINQFIDDLNGQPARPGISEERPGMLARMFQFERRQRDLMNNLRALVERVGAIEAELKPNGGGSMRDTIEAIAASVPSSPTPPEGGQDSQQLAA